MKVRLKVILFMLCFFFKSNKNSKSLTCIVVKG